MADHRTRPPCPRRADARQPAPRSGRPRPGSCGWLALGRPQGRSACATSSPPSSSCCSAALEALIMRAAARAARPDAAHAGAVQPALHDARRDDDLPLRAAGAVGLLATICGRCCSARATWRSRASTRSRTGSSCSPASSSTSSFPSAQAPERRLVQLRAATRAASTTPASTSTSTRSGMILLGISTTVGSVNFIVTLLRTRAPGMSINRVPILVWGTLTASVGNLLRRARGQPRLLPALARPAASARTSSTSPAAASRCSGSTCSGCSAIRGSTRRAAGDGHRLRRAADLLPPAAGRLHRRRAGHGDDDGARLRRLGAPHVRHRPAAAGAVVLQRGEHRHRDPERGRGVRLDRDDLDRTAGVHDAVPVLRRLHRAVRDRRRLRLHDRRGAGRLAAHRHLFRRRPPALRADRHQRLPGDRRHLLLVPEDHRPDDDERLGTWSFWIDVRRLQRRPSSRCTSPACWACRGASTPIRPGMGWDTVNLVITIGAFLFAARRAAVPRQRRGAACARGAPAGPNPWDAPTLEWSIASPPPPYNFAVIPIVASRHPLWEDRLERRRPERSRARPTACCSTTAARRSAPRRSTPSPT